MYTLKDIVVESYEIYLTKTKGRNGENYWIYYGIQ